LTTCDRSDDVEARRDVQRRHEHSRHAPLEAPRERLLPRVLGLVAVDRLGPDRVYRSSCFDDRVGAVLGARETSAFLMAGPSGSVLEELDLLGFLHVVDPLLHGPRRGLPPA